MAKPNLKRPMSPSPTSNYSGGTRTKLPDDSPSHEFPFLHNFFSKSDLETLVVLPVLTLSSESATPDCATFHSQQQHNVESSVGSIGWRLIIECCVLVAFSPWAVGWSLIGGLGYAGFEEDD
ncbi:hypothetical protein Drorol1_Dr00015009 [Drosera rotundifolia]